MSAAHPHAFADAEPLDDSALEAFARLLAIHRIAVDPRQLRHSLGHADRASAQDLLRLALTIEGVKAKRVTGQQGKLSRQPLPALANGPQGWFVIGRLLDDGVLIQSPGQQPRKIDRDEMDALWSGELILLTTRESSAGPARRFDMRWFIPQIVRYRRLIGEVLLLTLAINLLGLGGPLLFQTVIDKVLVHDSLSTLSVLMIALVGVSVWETAFGWMRTRLYSETSQKIDVELGARLFRHLLSLPLGYFEARRVGDTVTRVRQLETIREFLTNASLTVLVDPLFAMVFLVAMAVYSLKLLGVVAISLVAYVVVSQLVTGPLRERLNEKFERGSASQALLTESVTGIHTVKAAAVEPQWQERWERQLAGYSAASQRVINLNNSGSQAIQLISKLTLAAILYFGAREVIGGALTIGGLVAFNMFAQRVSGPVVRMAQLWQDFQQVRVSVERLGDVLNTAPEPTGASGVALPAIKGHVRFEDVRFRYAAEGPATLDGISLDIPSGSSIGIVGSSGSGKSTLAKLLQRLYMPASGRVLIDDVDVAQADPAWLRRQIGVVLQENLLFNRTIRENIALANPAMPVERVIQAAKLAGAHEFILRLPQGYDTPVVERGANLSGGQRQRIAIARALVTNPRILIFDEATSALDAESEEIVQRNLAAIAKGRTVIIIAHRLSAIRSCDRIVALEAGRVIESGSHHELLAAGGRYAALHHRQMGTKGLAA
ncbi:type I secretion system permease/ATPase [Sphingomonas quercus]|uniref:Type I secretion system permease/ATPase n=1 Tax=Sphingomonas quercus TaxID=2842451 RepID=A0ABS6BJ31_9SPHN|nr:type I secretion system permease/ATPase [Sphingomonas quercus]MBU3077200.1 type I secretion system permease/ATPase [Sphingomonas quercus]